MVKVIAEVIGIIGIICSILSFQCSQRKNVMLFQVLASLMFCTQLFLVGAVTGACLDSINFFSSLFFQSIRNGQSQTGGSRFSFCFCLLPALRHGKMRTAFCL